MLQMIPPQVLKLMPSQLLPLLSPFYFANYPLERADNFTERRFYAYINLFFYGKKMRFLSITRLKLKEKPMLMKQVAVSFV